ncbi:MAG: peptidoglycan DD-metalloendopeptidase family protein [Kiloniellaceae bacterium]
MSSSGYRIVRAWSRFRIAVLGAALAFPLLGGLAFAFWPGAGWHSGPISADLESETESRYVAALGMPDAAAIEAEVRPATVLRTLRVARGDTLMGLLTAAGIERREAHRAITALREVFRPRDLRPGQEIRLSLAPADGSGTAERLLALGLQPSVERDVRVRRADGAGFVAEALERPLERRTLGASGIIESNLSVAARAAGLPTAVMIDLIRVFSFDVDFQRELQAGDGFEVLYEALFEADGTMAKAEDVLYAALTLSGRRLELYNFTPKSGRTDFFDAKGQSVRKTLMRTPVDGARLSSRFGMRRHPILRYSKMHRGIDFAAPRGAPIYAAGDGVIERAGRNGAYGRYVRIRHNSTYKTAYAHMSRIAKGMRKGKRVKQGQVIGYVGSTGRSTGPHLHYEVMVGGRQVNPLKIKLPSGEKLKGKDLENFQARRAEIDALRELVRQGKTLLVRAPCEEPAPPTDGGLKPAGGC